MVRAVVTSEQGGVAVSWVGNTLTVTDGADFPRDGGQFIVEGDPATVYSYSLVTDGATEDDPDIITTVDPAPAGLPTGDEFRLTLWPAAVSSVAEVALPESTEDTVPAIIPHALKPYLPDGVRDPEAQEAVIIGQRDMAWVVVDILDQPEVVMAEVVQTVADARAEAMEAHGLASAATTAAQDAHNEAVAAQDTADAAVTAAGTAQATATNAAQAAADAAGVATSKADVLIQSTAPSAAYQKATTLWIDTTGGANTPKRWSEANGWVTVTDKAATDAAAAAAAAQTAATNAATAAQAAQDEAEDALAAAATAQSTADGKVTTFYGGTAPTATATGDLWVDTTANRLKRWNDTTWADVTDPVLQKALTAAGDAMAAADGKVRTFAQNEPPTGMVAADVGDLWVDTNDGNKLHRYSGSAWVAVQDASIATAKAAADAAAQAAANAAGIAGGKADVLIQSTAPAAAMQKATTLWIDTTGGTNKPKRWDGSAWAVVTDKAATDAATAAANAQTTATNAATAAANAQTAADNAAAAAAAAQTAAGNAQTTATNAMTSANGRNSRVTSTSAPSGSVNPNTGNAWVDGDTWWQWDSTTTRNVIGAWTRRAGAWQAEAIGHQTIASVDTNKLVVTGSAYMAQAVVDKIVGDAAYYKLFTADRIQLQAPGASVYYDGNFLDPGLSALRATNSGFSYNTILNTMTGTGSFWLTYNAQDEGLTMPLIVGQKYLVRVTGTGLTAGNYAFAVRDSAGYTVRTPTYTATGMEFVLTTTASFTRVNVYSQSTNSATIERVEFVAMVGSTLIEPGAITTEHLKATAIDGMVITGATIRTAATGARVQIDSAGIKTWDASGNNTAHISGTVGSLIGFTLTGGLIRTADGPTRVVLTGDGWQKGLTYYIDNKTAFHLCDYNGNYELRFNHPGTTTPSARLDASGFRLFNTAGAVRGVLTVGTNGMAIQSAEGTGQAAVNVFNDGDVAVNAKPNATSNVTIEGAKSVNINTLNTSTGFGTWRFQTGTISGVTRTEFRYVQARSGMPQTTLAANLHMDANGLFYATTSRGVYKVDQRPADYGDLALRLTPKTWIDASALDQDPDYRGRTVGLVLEDVLAVGGAHFASYNADGEPDGVMYDRIHLAYIPILQRHNEELATLRARVDRLENPA